MTKKRTFSMALFCIPAVLFLAVFIYFPLIENIIYSFHSFSLSSVTKEFVGLENYADLFKDKVIWTSLKNNILYAVVSIICQVFIALILAAVLEDAVFRKVGSVFRVIYFIPTVISLTVVCLLFEFVYNPQMGLLNSFLTALHLEDLIQVWLGSKKTAMMSIIMISQWQSFGYIMMLFIVAIQKIPAELYESAQLDGAGRIRRFIFITIPQVKEMIFVTMLMTVAGAFTVFNEPYIMTGGGPGTTTMVLALDMYQEGFVKNSMGYASAIAILIFVITAVLSSAQFFGFGRDEE